MANFLYNGPGGTYSGIIDHSVESAMVAYKQP